MSLNIFSLELDLVSLFGKLKRKPRLDVENIACKVEKVNGRHLFLSFLIWNGKNWNEKNWLKRHWIKDVRSLTVITSMFDKNNKNVYECNDPITRMLYPNRNIEHKIECIYNDNYEYLIIKVKCDEAETTTKPIKIKDCLQK